MARVMESKDIYKLIEEYQHVVEGKPRPSKIQGAHASHIIIDDLKLEGKGAWIFHEERVIARSSVDASVSLNFESNTIPDQVSSEVPYVTFTPGPMEMTLEIDKLFIVDHATMRQIEEEIGLMNIVIDNGSTTFTGRGYLISLGIAAAVDDVMTSSATFKIEGELIRNDD
jgi:hypothetical protein